MGMTSPLTRIQGIKAKWSIVIVVAVAITAAASQLGFHLGWPEWVVPVFAAALAFSAVQFLARGMTAPLRDMASAAAKVRRGQYGSQVDVTGRDEVGELAEAFNQMSAELAEVNRRQRDFIANASHELRAPVGALLSRVEKLVERIDEPDTATFEQMLAQTEHLAHLVRQLLDLNRLDVAANRQSRHLVAIGLLLQQVTGDAQLLHPSSNISVETSGPLGVKGDEALLRQMFANVVDNALRFSPIGSAVQIEAYGSEKSVLVTIDDCGSGIPAQHQTRVFEPFWQADRPVPSPSSTTDTGLAEAERLSREALPSGGGLGLAICRRIAEMHHGSIAISANRPKGTRVSITLPSRPRPD